MSEHPTQDELRDWDERTDDAAHACEACESHDNVQRTPEGFYLCAECSDEEAKREDIIRDRYEAEMQRKFDLRREGG